jgi:hypothetical protein
MRGSNRSRYRGPWQTLVADENRLPRAALRGFLLYQSLRPHRRRRPRGRPWSQASHLHLRRGTGAAGDSAGRAHVREAARVHHRPPAARPGHDHEPDPPARKTDELDRRAQRAPSHRTHPPAAAVEPGADQPTTPWLPQPDSQRPRQRRGSVTRGDCSRAVPTSGGPETSWPTNPCPARGGIPRPRRRRRASRTGSRPPPRPPRTRSVGYSHALAADDQQERTAVVLLLDDYESAPRGAI